MAGEVLSSWREGAVKGAILEFVAESATEGSERYIPVADRVAAFDNDGTLWVEKPAPVQAPFLILKLVAAVEADPSLAEKEPYRSIITGDEAFIRGVSEQDPAAVMSLLEGIGEAWEGTTPDEYWAEVEEFFAANTHERFGVPFTELVYQPMLELFDLLRSHDWRVFICSGGGRDFMRVICEQAWGLLPENVIGSAPEFEYRDRQLLRQAAVRGNIALGGGKPEHIFARTGKVAAFAAGNGDVDIEMLESAAFALLVRHDDPDREYAYTDAAERIIATATEQGWTQVSMKNDWMTVFVEGTTR